MSKTIKRKPSPAITSRGRPLPQAGEGKVRAGAFDASQIDFDPNSGTLDDDYEAFHKHKKALPEAEANAAENRFEAAFKTRHELQRRFVNNVFQFSIVCQYPACKRKESCAGDPYACHQRWWPWVPERNKAYYRAYVQARADGTHEQAHQHAEAEVKRLADHIAWVEAEQDARLDTLEAAERAQGGPRARIPSPLGGEGGEPSKRSEGGEPGEGFPSSHEPLTPPTSSAPLSHKGREKEAAGPRVRAL